MPATSRATDLSPLARHACEEAIRARLHQLDESGGRDGARRRSARRSSLNRLHLALADGSVDTLQVHLLLELLDAREAELDTARLPFWPGGQYGFLVENLDEKLAIRRAREELRAELF